VRAEPIRRRDPQHAVELLVLTRKLARKRQRLLLHAFGMGQHGRALVGQDEAIAGALNRVCPTDRSSARSRRPMVG
jgi:hypothetical protein